MLERRSMSYLKQAQNKYPKSFSKMQSLTILNKYHKQLDAKEYDAIQSSLCSHALENIYLDEKDILLSIAQLRGEVSLKEIVEIAKAF